MAALNVKGLLKKGADKAPEKSKKDEMPVVSLSKEVTLGNAHKKWVEAKKKITQAEADRKQAEEVLLPEADKGRTEHCLKNGKFFSSVKVKVPDMKLTEGGAVETFEPLTYSTQNRYSDIDQDKEDQLKQIFGEKFAQCIKENVNIELSDAAMVMIDDLLPVFVEAIGKHFKLSGEKAQEKFLELFSISRGFKPTEYLHENRVIDPAIKKMADVAIAQEIIKPVKGSFRNS